MIDKKLIARKREINQMKFYDEEKLLKIKNILIVAVLMLLTILLFFRVYDNFAKPIRLVTRNIFTFILSFVIVY